MRSGVSADSSLGAGRRCGAAAGTTRPVAGRRRAYPACAEEPSVGPQLATSPPAAGGAASVHSRGCNALAAVANVRPFRLSQVAGWTERAAAVVVSRCGALAGWLKIGKGAAMRRAPLLAVILLCLSVLPARVLGQAAWEYTPYQARLWV